MKNLKLEQKISREIDKLLDLTDTYISKEVSAHEMEKGFLRQLLHLGYVLLEYVIKQKVKCLKGYHPKAMEGEVLESKGMKSRLYLSLFGLMEFLRPGHWSRQRGSYYELDEQMKLPKGSHWSYNIQELAAENASEADYKESVRVLNKLLDLGLSGKSSQRNAGKLGPLADTYYENVEVEVENEAVCFSASFDGKGVPKIKGAQSKQGNPKKRLSPGEKHGTKQMALVAVMSVFPPKQRSAQSIIRSLMGSPLSKVEYDEQGRKLRKENDNRWHKNIHRRAFLGNQPKGVDYGIQYIKARMKNPNSRFIVPIDAGPGLEEKVLECVEKYGLQAQFDGIILDIVHVSEYVWDAATATFGESTLRAGWVRRILEELLDSKTDQVISYLEQIRDKTTLSDNKKKQLSKTINYFTNHKHKMDYKKFIEKGYPVSSALVEAACGHLVKERMEQSGMRWASEGAQNIMDLRAIKQNEDMEDFMDFVIKQERKGNYTKAA